MDSYKVYSIANESFGDGIKEEPIEDRLIKTKYDFARYVEYGKDNNQNGAVVVFTGKQYVFLKNNDNGRAGHVGCFARAYLEMEGDHRNLKFSQANYEVCIREKNYATMTFEAEMPSPGEHYYAIRFFFHGTISPAEFASFQSFYDEFADTIKTLPFTFFVRDDLNGQQFIINNIDHLLEILKTKVDYNKEPYVSPKGELIVGNPNGYGEPNVERIHG